MDNIQNNINTLANIDNQLLYEEQNQTPTSVSVVEKSLSEFVQDSFNVTRRDYEFNQKIQEAVAERLANNEFSNAELIALLTNNKVNDSDRLSKLLAPTFQMLTAKQNAEIQAASQERQAAVQAGAVLPSASNSSSMKDLNNAASAEILQGMAQLQNLLSGLMVTPVEVKDDNEKKE